MPFFWQLPAGQIYQVRRSAAPHSANSPPAARLRRPELACVHFAYGYIKHHAASCCDIVRPVSLVGDSRRTIDVTHPLTSGRPLHADGLYLVSGLLILRAIRCRSLPDDTEAGASVLRATLMADNASRSRQNDMLCAGLTCMHMLREHLLQMRDIGKAQVELWRTR